MLIDEHSIYRFEPRLWSIIVTIAAILIFANLGLWQLSRADEKQSKHEQLEQL